MALSDYDTISKILVQPGRLVKDPTDLATTFPYGGTSLGMTENGVIIQRLEENFLVLTTEESGKKPVKVIHLGEHWQVSCELVEWNDTVIDLFAQGYITTGATSGLKNITWPGDGTTYAGKDLSGSAIKLLFAPEDTTNNKVFLARKAIPIGPAHEIQMKASEKSILLVRFVILEDTSIGSADARYNYRGFFFGDIRDVAI